MAKNLGQRTFGNKNVFKIIALILAFRMFFSVSFLYQLIFDPDCFIIIDIIWKHLYHYKVSCFAEVFDFTQWENYIILK